MQSLERSWIIAALTHRKLPALNENQFDGLVEVAAANGVLVVLENRLQSHPQISEIPTELLVQLQSTAKQSLLEQMVFLGEQKKVFDLLNQANIPYILMKGAALGKWLYVSPLHRPVTDIDIWLKDRASVFALHELLQPLGYVCQPSLGELTTQEQAFDKTVNDFTIRIDAHWQMFNSALLAKHIDFDDMYKRAVACDTEFQNGKYLAITDALINSIGHRAMKYISKNGYVLKWLYDQHLMFSQLSSAQWQELTKLSQQFGISDLSLDAVQVCSEQFATVIPDSVIHTLESQSKNEMIHRGWFQSWPSYQWHEMCAAAPSIGAKCQWLQQRFWPNPDAVRDRYGKDDSVWKFMLKRIAFGLRRLFGLK